jgi:hypothetical protein
MERNEGCVYIEPPTDERMEELIKIFESFGLTVTVGG